MGTASSTYSFFHYLDEVVDISSRSSKPLQDSAISALGVTES